MAIAPRSSPGRLARLILLALCAAAAGCGGDDGDGPSDAQQIATSVQRVMESENVRDQCETGVSDRFVREVYRTPARCREANKPAADDEEPDTATTAATRIDGDRATTGVTLTSVKGARATGRLALVKEGATWKVDRLGADFLRSIVQALPKQADTAGERLVLDCLAQAARGLSSGEVRRFGNLMVGRQLTEQTFPPGALRCIRAGASQQEQATTA